MRPVTSTRVATKGADEVAGSSFKVRRRKGSMDPEIVPHKTTPTSENDTVTAIKSQCGPYTVEKLDQIEMRRNPITPSTRPRIKPQASSRRITRHQSRKRTSPMAIARIIRVVA